MATIDVSTPESAPTPIPVHEGELFAGPNQFQVSDPSTPADLRRAEDTFRPPEPGEAPGVDAPTSTGKKILRVGGGALAAVAVTVALGLAGNSDRKDAERSAAGSNVPAQSGTSNSDITHH